MSGMEIKALVFDVFGTVVDWRGSVVREGEALAQRHGGALASIDWGAFADTWRREGYSQAIRRIVRGEQPWEGVDTLHRRKLDELLKQHGVTTLAEPDVAHFNRVWHRLQPWPDSVPGLTRLRRRHVIAPLSNGSLSLLTNMAKQAGLPWDCILAAELFGAYKPDPKVYLGAVRLLDLAPSQILMVAAHPGDLEAAHALGLRTAYVPRPQEFGPQSPPPTPPPAGSFDLTVDSFVHLAAALDT